MPLPSPVERAYDYTTWQAANPAAPLPADRIETDFDNLGAFTLQLIDYLAHVTPGGELRITGGTMEGPLILQANPTTALGAATKAYVDSVVLAGGLPTTGGTVTGFITLHANPTAALHAATKGYVDSVVVAGGLPLSGGTLTGNTGISAANAALTLNKAASAQYSRLSGQQGGSVRWNLDLGNATAETGANAGSDFALHRYSDAGAFLGTAFAINRATGAASFAGAVSSAGNNTATAFRGGPGDAGHLRMWGSGSHVNFRLDPSLGSVVARVDEAVERRLVYSDYYYSFQFYSYGPQPSVIFYGTDGTYPIVFIDAFSDERLKANIRPAGADALGLMLQLDVSDFDWNEDGARNQGVEPGGSYASVRLGLIAQNVEAHFPGAVSEAPAVLASGSVELRKKVNNAALVPALIRAVQQLEARVRELESHA